MTLRFLANDSVVETGAWGLAPALDLIRRDLGLTGTKEGCREGDCGACAVMVGARTPEDGRGGTAPGQAHPSPAPRLYRAMPSCLLATGELEGCHLVTIEGLAAGGQTPVMRALAEANGSQCGFCSPGFVISLTAYLINGDSPSGNLSVEGAFTSVEGNLCRCTGYGAIKRAASRLVAEFAGLPSEPFARLDALVKAGVIPASMPAYAKGELLPTAAAGDGGTGDAAGAAAGAGVPGGLALAGGSDFFVRNPTPEPDSFPAFVLVSKMSGLRGVRIIDRGEAEGGATLELGAALTWREFFSEPRILELVPGIQRFEKLLASPLVRERATIGGNIANASPVGDVTAMLIALGAWVRLAGGGVARELPLERLFLGYKKLDLRPPTGGTSGEIISAVLLPASRPFALFNFEKVSKRERLDIAAVNSAAAFEMDGGLRIARARISAGGVAPVPLFLAKASSFLEGRTVGADVALEAAHIAAGEATPIGDVRGGADYRRRLLERLVLGHFIRLFPGAGIEGAVQ